MLLTFYTFTFCHSENPDRRPLRLPVLVRRGKGGKYLRLAHLAGTGSERKRPGLVAVVVVVLPFWASAQAATRQKVANAKVTFICKKKKRIRRM